MTGTTVPRQSVHPHQGGPLAYLNVLGSLARAVWRPLDATACRALIRERLGTRDARFLDIMRRLVFGHATSPYRHLLAHAGCTYGDIAAMMRTRGLDGTLVSLRDAGVYLSFEEFSGRIPVVRGSRTFQFTEQEFDNPLAGVGTEIRTSATRSRGSRLSVALVYVAEQRTPSWSVTLEALGAGEGPVVIWMPAVTHGGGLMWWLALLQMGRPARRWFSMIGPEEGGTSRRHRVLFRLARAIGWTRGIDVPLPEHAPLSRADIVLDSVLEMRRRSRRCTVIASPSAATRLALLARERRVDLRGVVFLVGGEPLTDGKAAEVHAVGGRIGSMYVLSEAGAVGGACGAPEAPDDMHFMADAFALITRSRAVAGFEVSAYMLTGLLASAPKVLINVETDDFGVFVARRCGCVFDDLGLPDHLRDVRSFSKLTGEGVTVLGTDCVRILEEVLPREFGGTSIDYQLLETEDAARLTRLLLVISPRVGPVDETRVRARFIEELRGTGPRGTLPPLWLQAETIQVVRREPVPTPGGKNLPFLTQAPSAFGAVRGGGDRSS